MKKELMVFIVSISFEILFFSCNVAINDDSRQNSASPKSSDTIVREIPLNQKGQFSRDYGEDKTKAFLLNLDSLELGYDSLQIRIWFDYSLAIKNHLVIIKKSLSGWSSEVYTYTYNAKTRTIEDKQIEAITPKSSWENLTKKLFELEIMGLPNGKTIPGLEGGLDGTSYNVEVATKKGYRYYSYWSPETTQNKFWQANNMVKIIELLEDEFNFKRLQK